MKIIQYFLIVFLLSGTSSCIHLQPKNELSDEQLLASRADQYWEAYTSRNWKVVHDLIDPAIKDELTSYIDTLRSSEPTAEYMYYKKKNIEIDGQKAEVTYEVMIKYLHPYLQELPPQKKFLTNNWIKRNENWYIIMREFNVQDFFDSLQSHVK
ncbi:MAG: hypothetical protein U5L00_13535 [Desulfovermiculus sp.]|nr:hypothetical protein [Desulfovermiculus sp.]